MVEMAQPTTARPLPLHGDPRKAEVIEAVTRARDALDTMNAALLDLVTLHGTLQAENTPPPAVRWLTVEETAERFRVSTDTMRKWLARESLRPLRRKIGTAVRVREADLLALEAALGEMD